MKELFTSLKGIQIVLQAITLCVSFLVFSNDVVEGSVKKNESFKKGSSKTVFF
ncbi:hypothetical protein SIN01_28200 [Sporolactobacillus inulinus]|nr:hypothetical protein SIN01_28200 [Sporolactobacillus inulinus]